MSLEKFFFSRGGLPEKSLLEAGVAKSDGKPWEVMGLPWFFLGKEEEAEKMTPFQLLTKH